MYQLPLGLLHKRDSVAAVSLFVRQMSASANGRMRIAAAVLVTYLLMINFTFVF